MACASKTTLNTIHYKLHDTHFITIPMKDPSCASFICVHVFHHWAIRDTSPYEPFLSPSSFSSCANFCNCVACIWLQICQFCMLYCSLADTHVQWLPKWCAHFQANPTDILWSIYSVVVRVANHVLHCIVRRVLDCNSSPCNIINHNS